MLYFHCTQKLLRALDLPIHAPPKESGGSPLGVWYANIINFNNMIFLFFVNDPTLYTVVLHFSGIANSAQVFKTFRENLATSLASDGINQRRIQHLLDDHQQGVFVKTTSRSMIGSMNDLIDIFLFHIDRNVADHNQIDLHKIQYALNRMPQRKIDWGFSVDAMHGSLQYFKVV
jgi:hypothetical protein